MPYRRLPKSDVVRLKALKTVLDSNDIYAARGEIVSWKTLADAQRVYNELSTAKQQLDVYRHAESRHTAKLPNLQRKAMMYLSHFMQVLFMSVERGEIKKSLLSLYGLDSSSMVLPPMQSVAGLLQWGERVIEGEKERLKKGGRPIYNPTIGMVSTHYDIFAECVRQQEQLSRRTSDALSKLKALRDESDAVLLDMWNQIEAHFSNLPPEHRYNEARRYGVIYYYRRHEEHIY